ncbi:MAG TPA: PAS domain-containing protein [Caulobacteraceae bacterium]|jgi:hypothetical protein
MFHSSTELLIDYWRRRCGGRPMPARADIDPSGFAHLAAQAFIAVREDGGDVRLRLAGEAVGELHGRRVAGESLLRLWRAGDRGRLARLLAAALANGDPLVALADGGCAELEILFAPLTGAGGAADRFLGLYQPTRSGELGQLGELAILGINGAAGSERPAHLRLAALDGRRIA